MRQHPEARSFGASTRKFGGATASAKARLQGGVAVL
jgi:hypothetical protein